jgi:hypothetical protein
MRQDYEVRAHGQVRQGRRGALGKQKLEGFPAWFLAFVFRVLAFVNDVIIDMKEERLEEEGMHNRI